MENSNDIIFKSCTILLDNSYLLYSYNILKFYREDIENYKDIILKIHQEDMKIL